MPASVIRYFLEMQTIGTDGLFGDPVYVAAKYAFLFVLFGNLYVISGGAQLFFDVAAAVTGRSIGGPAKACVVSSALYGTVSGSPVADVATTGPITIPIMKRIGISPERAGAIEASSSIGGALLPPVMGAVAFLMADFTGIPYYLIAWYALLPSLGYYLGVFVLVHFEAVRLNLGRVPEEEIVGLRVALTRNWPSADPDRGPVVAADLRLFGRLCRRRIGAVGDPGELVPPRRAPSARAASSKPASRPRTPWCR